MQMIIQDKVLRLPIDFLAQELDEICFLRCKFVGESDFVINKHCSNIIILESSSSLERLNFNSDFGYNLITFLTSNCFDDTEIILSGKLESVKFDSLEFTHAGYIPELRRGAKESCYGIIRIEYGAVIDNLYIDTARILKSIKFTGTSKLFSVRNVQIADDITIIPELSTNINIVNIKTGQVALTGAFGAVVISGENYISSLSFKVEGDVNKLLNIDLSKTDITHELQFSSLADPKLIKCEISNIECSSIKSLTFHKSQMSCFSLINCDLSETHVVFKHCKIDDISMEGVIWPHDVHSSHFNYKADTVTELNQIQSVYRQLKAISHKNKDIDSFVLFRRRECDTMSQLSLVRAKMIFVYFFLKLLVLLNIKKDTCLPKITHRRHSNKVSDLIYEITSYIILRISSILSAHNTSLFRPVIFLVVGTPVFLCLFGYYSSLEQLIQLSAHVINPTHKDEVKIIGENIAIYPAHSLFFRIYSSVLLYKIVMSFRRYSSI